MARAKKYGDLFEPVLKLKQRMPSVEALQQLEAGASAKPEPSPRRAAAASEPKKKAATPRAKSKASAAKKAPPRRKRV